MTTQTTMPPEPPTAEPRQGGPGRESGRGPDNAPVGPGAQLRQARLDLKLAPEDVANILHLSSRQIVTLENDDYANLAGPTYVRGYLRGYAQLLGLSPEPIVEAYNRLAAARKPVDLGKLAPKPEIRSDHQLVKFATIGVAALILGLSAVWWQEQDEPAPVVTSDSAPAPAEPDQPAATDPAPIPADLGVKEEPSSAAPAPAALPPITNQGTVTKPANPAPEKTPARTAVVPPPAAIQEPAVTSPEPPAPKPDVAGPRGRLMMQTNLDSWADVRDANGNRLLYEMVPAGRTVVVEGVAPLSVFLGNAEGVRVEFNGEAYDVSRHRRGDIARFTLGAASRPAQPRVE